ncbi:XrtA/PEP-CTERM system histidine kinase PrsK [Sphingomonas sp. 10B4]|uniref:XrtA/PEP-CTERM system histidine kinase PrsK n=1 Tax=Sphingomonas sp. 10B4 TaxID=3048575 RepID=UPI002AB543AC|nr:XrtA/PEP-CTERM system histidine kinase PrsK [Sphingomonas sp. 10B4]MDY7524914.1 PEP-CTERM system histidine kinase PrsK [Sphingomonas sp. 10B4]MEB0282140.1 PEP-CTERM system histidine kinase PrsK [Sphingomonas sp. 10B4]
MTGTAPLILWSHALAAFLFAGVAASRLRERGKGLPRLPLVCALGLTALWALAVAGIEASDVVTRVAEGLRNLAWLAFMHALVRHDLPVRERRAIGVIYGVVALVSAAGIGLAILEQAVGVTLIPQVAAVRLLLRSMVAIVALLLVHHLYATATPRSRAGLRLVVFALGAMWGIDLLLYVSAYISGGAPTALTIGRGFVMALVAPVLAVAVQRNGEWTLQVSRTVAWQTVSFAVTLLYAAVMFVATSAIASISGDNARLWQTAFVFGSTAAGVTILSSPWVRAWAKVKVSKHFFRHRYDYRAEWIRFTDTLGKPDDAASLDARIVKAVADLTDSPAGLLLVPDGAGLGVGAGWNWDAPSAGAEAALVTHLARTGRIVELDAVRADTTDAAESASVPIWMLDSDGWVLLPLVHLDRLQGAILLARPPIDRALDWEDFDLLRIAGRQVASYLAEERAQSALAEAKRFDEFNRRFAFILHDIKNLVSQLSLVARNAERHADNPAFRADMIATLQDSAGRMNDLLARLSQHHHTRAEELRPVEVLALAELVAARRRAQHPVVVSGTSVFAHADPFRLEQALGHLLQNAIEASPPTEPVTLAVSGDAKRVSIAVIDQGCGMSPAFLREQLFKPFASSKPGGFGIGAFEARQLAEAMGGSVAVESREGAGTTFHVTLTAARTISLDQAA